MARSVESLVASIAVAIMFGCALPIAELVLGSQYNNNPDNTCDNGRLIQPTTWLIVGGSVDLFCTVILIPMFFMMLCNNRGSAFSIFLLFVAILGGLFDFAWAIIGSCVLWRDNVPCGPQPLHDMMYASVIIRLIGLVETRRRAKTD